MVKLKDIIILIKRNRIGVATIALIVFSGAWFGHPFLGWLLENYFLDPFLKPFIDKIPLSHLVVFIVSVLSIRVSVFSAISFLVITGFVYKSICIAASRCWKFELMEAKYGSGTKFVDITDQLNNFVIDNRLKIPMNNGTAGLDPTPAARKIVKIKYRLSNRGSEKTKTYKEGETINLPTIKIWPHS